MLLHAGCFIFCLLFLRSWTDISSCGETRVKYTVLTLTCNFTVLLESNLAVTGDTVEGTYRKASRQSEQFLLMRSITTPFLMGSKHVKCHQDFSTQENLLDIEIDWNILRWVLSRQSNRGNRFYFIKSRHMKTSKSACKSILLTMPGFLLNCTTLAKKIETAMRAKHRCVHAREITRLRHVRAAVSIFWPG